MPANEDTCPLSPSEIEELAILLDVEPSVIGRLLVVGDSLPECRALLFEERLRRSGGPARALDPSRRDQIWKRLGISALLVKLLELKSQPRLLGSDLFNFPTSRSESPPTPPASTPQGEELAPILNDGLGWFYTNIFPIPAYFLRPFFGPHRDADGQPRDAMFSLVVAGFMALCFAAFFLVWWFLPGSHFYRALAILPPALGFVAACGREITRRQRWIYAVSGVLVGLVCWAILPTSNGMNLLWAEYRAMCHRGAMPTASVTQLAAGDEERTQILRDFLHLASGFSTARRTWLATYSEQFRAPLREKAITNVTEALIDIKTAAGRLAGEKQSDWHYDGQQILFRARLEVYARSLRPMLVKDQFHDATVKARELVKDDQETARKLGLDTELNEFLERYAYLSELANLARKR